MPLHPQAQALLEQMKQMGLSTHRLTVDRAREVLQTMIAARGSTGTGCRVEDRLIPGPAGDIPIRIYTPHGTSCAGLVFSISGWMYCRLSRLSSGSRTSFPGGMEDSYAATYGWLLMPLSFRVTPHVLPSGAIVLEGTSRRLLL